MTETFLFRFRSWFLGCTGTEAAASNESSKLDRGLQKKRLQAFVPAAFLQIRFLVAAMATKIKGIYKSFKFISQIFVVKEREMEIGYPTDVKHVAHIGWDGSGSAPSWMNEFKSAPDFSTALGTIADTGDSNSVPRSTWSSQDFEQLMTQQAASELFKDQQLPPDLPNPKKKTRKKSKSRSSKERLHF